MKPTIQIYRVSLIRTLLICSVSIIIFLCNLILSCIMFYVAFSMENIPFIGKLLIVVFALFWSIYVGFYPLVIYWNYYRHDKHVSLTINKRDNVIIYRNKNVVKEIKMKDIVRLEQYFSDVRMLSMKYYKIIITEAHPITITCLLNIDFKKELNNTFCSRILERYLWLLKRDN